MTEPGGEDQTADVEMVDADAPKDVVVVDEGAPPADGEAPAESGDAPAEKAADGEAVAEEPTMVPPEVKPELMEQMVNMGFSKERSLRAIHFSGNSTLEGAMNWLDEHQTDADIDEPLLVPEGGASDEQKKKLTPEEAKAKAAELQAKAKARREAAEKETDAQREKMRINMGKEMAAAYRQEQETKLQRMAEERKREKDEMEAARAKLKVKMEEDRKARRRKLGLPEELTPEELEEERRKAEEKAAAEAKKKLPVKPVSRISKMRDILVSMKKAGHEEAKFQTCCKTLTAYCRNVYANLDDDSKRKIKCSNKAFQERVAAVPGGVDFLNQVGFQEEEGFMVMQKVDTFTEKALLEGAGEVLSSAMTNPMFGVL